MNICFVCREYPPAPSTGGIGWVTRDHARALARLGHRVHVVAPAWQGTGTSDDAGVAVHRVRAPRWQIPVVARRVGQTLDRMGWSLAAARAVDRIHRSEGIDVVEAPEFAAEGFAASRRSSPAVVIRLHTPLALVRRLNGSALTLDCRLTVGLERRTLSRAVAVTAPSRAIAAACARAGYGPRAATATIVPSGVDVAVFSPDGRAQEGPPVVLFIGRLEARKGIADLVEALPKIAANVPEARFAFVGADTPTAPGGGWWRERVMSVSRGAGMDHRVDVVGSVGRDELPARYRAAAVVVAPSPFEALGLVYVEAMACGRPVVGCAGGAFPEIAADGREGRAVPPRDPAALADAVVGLLQDPVEAGAMGRRARRRAVAGFAVERAAERSAELYAEVCGR